MHDKKLSSGTESAQPNTPSKEALISPFEVVVEDAVSEEVVPAQRTEQDFTETESLANSTIKYCV